MTAAGGAPGRWGTALGLFVAVLLLSALDGLPLLTLPLAVIILSAPFTPRWKWLLVGGCLGLLGVSAPGGELANLSRAWALLLGGGFVAATAWRPGWGVLQRSLIALAGALGVVALWLGATGEWVGLDERIGQHLTDLSESAVAQLRGRAPEAEWVTELATAAQRTVDFQWTVFPALVGLQSLAALGLACWFVSRARGSEPDLFTLGPVREFRFPDQLVWVVIGGLVLVILPLGDLATRLGWNALFFMGALYALRGIGIFVFLSARGPKVFLIVVSVLALLLFYPLVVSTVILLGLVDTWFDLRSRATVPPQSPS
jgi:hypothetical protein